MRVGSLASAVSTTGTGCPLASTCTNGSMLAGLATRLEKVALTAHFGGTVADPSEPAGRRNEAENGPVITLIALGPIIGSPYALVRFAWSSEKVIVSEEGNPTTAGRSST